MPTLPHSITNAVSSRDAADIMEGYVDALLLEDGPDRQTVLDYLLRKLPTSSGDFVRAERTANNAYSYLPTSSPERQAALQAYWALFEPVKASGLLQLALQIASTAHTLFPSGSLDKELAKSAAATLHRQLGVRMTSDLVGHGVSTDTTLGQLAKGIREMQANQKRGMGSMAPR